MTPGREDCRAVVANLSAYLDGDLESAACDVIEQHCRGCARCTALVDSLRDMVGLCRRAGTAPLPKDVRMRARARLQQLLDDDRQPAE